MTNPIPIEFTSWWSKMFKDADNCFFRFAANETPMVDLTFRVGRLGISTRQDPPVLEVLEPGRCTWIVMGEEARWRPDAEQHYPHSLPAIEQALANPMTVEERRFSDVFALTEGMRTKRERWKTLGITDL